MSVYMVVFYCLDSSFGMVHPTMSEAPFLRFALALVQEMKVGKTYKMGCCTSLAGMECVLSLHGDSARANLFSVSFVSQFQAVLVAQ